jgi:hypothetical protein
MAIFLLLGDLTEGSYKFFVDTENGQVYSISVCSRAFYFYLHQILQWLLSYSLSSFQMVMVAILF